MNCHIFLLYATLFLYTARRSFCFCFCFSLFCFVLQRRERRTLATSESHKSYFIDGKRRRPLQRRKWHHAQEFVREEGRQKRRQRRRPQSSRLESFKSKECLKRDVSRRKSYRAVKSEFGANVGVRRRPR